MMQHWHSLQAREQRTLLVGGVLVVLMLLYVLVIDPAARELQRLERAVADNRALLGWMEQTSQQVKALRGTGGRRGNGQSLLSLVDASAKRDGLGSALKQVKPEGGEGVRLRFEEAGFDDLLRWLGRLGSEQGIAVSMLTLERLAVPGRVNVTVVLERGG